MLLSLSIAVYNKPENLRLVLGACARQTLKEFEVIVADDGSGPDVAQVVRDARERYGLTITHLWHEDDGWRKNAMLNNAIRAAGSDYMVFIDGDCIPHRRFLEDHWSEAEGGRVLCGRRVEMGARWASQLSEEFIASGRFERIGAAEIRDALRGDAHRVEDGVRIGSGALARMLHSGSPRILGCNFSIHRRELEAINGFDESYRGPGCGEDSDIEFRLGLNGVTTKALRHKGIQYHIHHRLTTVGEECRQRFEEVRARRSAWCEMGLRYTGAKKE